jgi:predicted metalloprotease
MRTKLSLLVSALAVVLVAAACGSKKDDTTSPPTPPKPSAAKNKQLKAPSTPQPGSASKKADKKTIAQLPKAGKPGEGKTPQLKGLEGKTVEEKLQIFAQDIGDFWQRGFSDTQVKFQPATVYIVTSPQQVGCDPPGSVGPNDNPFYCRSDGSLSLPVDNLTTIDQDPKFGDASVATIVGAFYGLHVENVVGLLKDRTGPEVFETAICLDGVWARSVYKRDLLDPGDLDKVGATLAAAADDSTSAKTLIKAFNAGYTTGNPGNCVQGSGSAGTG